MKISVIPNPFYKGYFHLDVEIEKGDLVDYILKERRNNDEDGFFTYKSNKYGLKLSPEAEAQIKEAEDQIKALGVGDDSNLSILTNVFEARFEFINTKHIYTVLGQDFKSRAKKIETKKKKEQEFNLLFESKIAKNKDALIKTLVDNVKEQLEYLLKINNENNRRLVTSVLSYSDIKNTVKWIKEGEELDGIEDKAQEYTKSVETFQENIKTLDDQIQELLSKKDALENSLHEVHKNFWVDISENWDVQPQEIKDLPEQVKIDRRIRLM